jgi:acyl-CoA thioesterase YciA
MDLICTRAIKHSDLGYNGTLFGGQLLKWIDGDTVAYAMQLCDTPRMVTVSIDKCVFEKPVKESHLVKIYSKPIALGTCSITLHVEARRHNVYTGDQTIVLSTNIKFVRVDEDGNPIPISDRVRNKIKFDNEDTTKHAKSDASRVPQNS